MTCICSHTFIHFFLSFCVFLFSISPFSCLCCNFLLLVLCLLISNFNMKTKPQSAPSKIKRTVVNADSYLLFVNGEPKTAEKCNAQKTLKMVDSSAITLTAKISRVSEGELLFVVSASGMDCFVVKSAANYKCLRMMVKSFVFCEYGPTASFNLQKIVGYGSVGGASQ